MNQLAAYLRLMRISLLPTAWSNILMGVAISGGLASSPVNLPLALLVLLTCSSCLYLAGMVLNDVCDYETDCSERPERVLPSGKISLRNARIVGYGLLFLALTIAAIAGTSQGKSGLIVEPLLPVSIALAFLIVVYNRWAKRSFLGPVVMGLCRTFNVLLGCSLFVTNPFVPGLNQTQWFIALAVGLYVAGITWFAKQEHRTSERKFLWLGAATMMMAIGMLFWFPFSQMFLHSEFMVQQPRTTKIQWLYCGLLAMMIFPVVRKVTVAVVSRESAHVKQAVITSLLSIIMIDASICYLVSANRPEYALIVASLIVPAFLLSRRVMAT